jgi:glucose/arabinose dehydrogenase
MRTPLPCLLVLAAACADPDPGTMPPPPPPPEPGALALELVASGLASPLLLTAPAGDPRLFVVEQPGRIRIVANGVLQGTPYLDIADRVQAGGERGLLGLAFHPDYPTNGVLVVNYTGTDGDTRISSFRIGADPDQVAPVTERILLTIDQPFANHNGGHLAFGPDGMLYVATGDGGSANDPLGNAQNLGSLLGKLLRLRILADGTMEVPDDNPFTGVGQRPEIWSYGLRNPWRFAFDRATTKLWIADVGQGAREEINHVDHGHGLDFGWPDWEGSRCNAGDCSAGGETFPAHEYGHDEGCSVTGGYPYRGTVLGAAFVGTYFFGDYCGGWVRTFNTAREVHEWASLAPNGSITSFGEDASGELYVLIAEGRVYRIVRG